MSIPSFQTSIIYQRPPGRFGGLDSNLDGLIARQLFIPPRAHRLRGVDLSILESVAPCSVTDVKMVYYFKSTAVDPPAFIYVGKDKVESASSVMP